MSDILLAVDKLCVCYSKVKKGFNYAINQVSFEINRGETLGVVGESGSGKTSLGRAIVGLVPIISGAVYFKGCLISQLNRRAFFPYRKKIQMIFQDPFGSLNPRMTLESILKEPLEIHFKHFSKQQQHKRMLELLDQVRLSKNVLKRYPNEFSGGQRQRIGIARALAVEPELLICDEPVSALDVSIQAQIINLLVDLQKDLGLTYLFISHDMAIVRHMSNYVAVMQNGCFVEQAPVNKLYTQPHHSYTKTLLASIPKI